MDLTGKDDYYLECPKFHGVIKVSLCNTNYKLGETSKSGSSLPEKSILKTTRYLQCHKCKHREQLTEDQLIHPDVIHNGMTEFINSTPLKPTCRSNERFEKEVVLKMPDDFSYE